MESKTISFDFYYGKEAEQVRGAPAQRTMIIIYLKKGVSRYLDSF